MKEIIRMFTPIGEGTVNYGEFMPGDGRKKEYHCWWGGCGIGGRSKTLVGAKKHLDEYVKDSLTREKNKLEEKLADILIYLRAM